MYFWYRRCRWIFWGKIAEAISNQQTKKFEVYFIARGEHLKAIKQRGITVKTPERIFSAKPTLATSDIDEIPSPDLILLCVKSYDLKQAVASIKPVINGDSVIIPLLNGIDISERIREVMDTGIVLPACLYLGTHIESSGSNQSERRERCHHFRSGQEISGI